MARKKPSILGELSGKVGDLVYKIRDGKPYVSKAPETHTLSMLPHEIDKRNIQSVNGKFASLINKNALLKAAWGKEKKPCNCAYNKISQVNYYLCEQDHPSEKAMMTPPGGFRFEAEDIKALPDRIEIMIRPTKLQKDENSIAYIMILCLWNPRRKGKKTKPFEFLMPQDYITEGNKVIFRFDKEGAVLFKKYKNKMRFLAAVTADKQNKIVRWSDTLVRDL